MLKQVLLVCLLFIVIQAQYNSTTNSTTLGKIQKEKDEIQKLLNNFKFSTQNLKASVTKIVLADIKENGLYLGTTWRIHQEGTGSYDALVFKNKTVTRIGQEGPRFDEVLVFRDLNTTRTGIDARYAFFQDRFQNL